MKNVVLVVLISISAGAIARRALSQESAFSSVSQVIEGDELQALGLTRLGDVLRQLEGARFLTIDGLSYQVSLNGLASFHDRPPDLFVDGHPVDLSPLQGENLSLLGVPMESIERIEVFARPALISGFFASRGAIHIRTRPAGSGYRLQAAMTAANEVGDPGPFRSGGAPNVDTQGPDGSISAEAVSNQFAVKAAGVYRRHYLTKPVLLQRLRELHDPADAPIAEIIAPTLSLQWRRPAVDVSLLGTGVASILYPYLDFAAREVALQHRAMNISAIVRHQLTQESTLRHLVSMSLDRSREPAASAVPFTWDEDRIVGHTSWSRLVKNVTVDLGGSAGYERVRSAPDRSEAENPPVRVEPRGLYRWAEIFGGITTDPAEEVSASAVAMLAAGGGSIAVKSFADAAYAPARAHRVRLHLALVNSLLHDDLPMEFWAERGVAPELYPRPRGGPLAVGRPENSSVRASGDLEWRWSPGLARSVAAGFGLRHFSGTNLFSREMAVDEGVIRSETLRFARAEGTNGVLWLGAEMRLMPGTQRVFISHTSTLVGDTLFRQVWDVVPDAHYGVSIYLPVAPDFQVHGRIARQSGSFWREFVGLAGANPRVKGSTMLDLALYKRLAAGRLHLRLAFSNVLREGLRYHPVGDTFDLSARIDVRLELGSLR